MKKNCPVGKTFVKYDDHIMLCRQTTNELHISEVRECIRIDNELHDHELHLKLFFTSALDHFHSGFGMDAIAS